MAIRRKRFRTIARKLRPVEWAGSLLDTSISVSPGTIQRVILTGTFSPAVSFIEEYTQPTLMRTRGQFLATRTSEGTAIGAVGIIAQIPDQTTLLPADIDPAENPELEWLWWHPVLVSDNTGNDSSYQRTDIDSKAMRKLYNGEQLYLYVSNPELTSATFDFDFALRYLIKE